MPIVLKSGNLNILENSGPFQACNGIALPLPFTFRVYFAMCVTFCVRYLHMMILHLRKVSENLHRLGCTFRADVNEILFTEYRETI